jgi:parvulin-like peptidyl-prolyl isomerase
MKKISQLCVLLCAIAPMAAFSVTPDQPASTNSAGKPSLDALFGDSVVAKGKGLEIKRAELDDTVIKMKAAYASQQMPAPANLESQALKNLVIQKLILSKATGADRATGKTNYQEWVSKVKEANHFTDDEFNKALEQKLFGGESRAEWEQQRTEVMTIPVILERELKVNITDDDIKKFYDDPANIAAFEQPEKVRVSHILLTTEDPATHEPLPADKKAEKKKQLEDILKRARTGEDFTKLADQYSEDPGVKQNHGEYTFSKDEPYDETFKATSFSLTNGQISDIITSQFGYHIIKLDEKIPAKKVELDKVKDGIKDHLVQLEFQKKAPAYTAQLVKDANIEILDDKLKGTDFSIEQPKEETAPPAATPAPTPAK